MKLDFQVARSRGRCGYPDEWATGGGGRGMVANVSYVQFPTHASTKKHGEMFLAAQQPCKVSEAWMTVGIWR